MSSGATLGSRPVLMPPAAGELTLCFASPEEEYKRLSEALADEGTYNAVAFKYSADYYDPSQPTEEEEAARETGETTPTHTHTHAHTQGTSC